MFTLDASVFVRDLTPNDPDYAICRELLERLRASSTPSNAPLLLLAEVAGVLSRELRDPMRGRLAVSVLEVLPNLSLIALDQELVQEAAEIAADRALRGADARMWLLLADTASHLSPLTASSVSAEQLLYRPARPQSCWPS